MSDEKNTSNPQQESMQPQENKQGAPVPWSAEGFDFHQSVFLEHRGQAPGQQVTADVMARFVLFFFVARFIFFFKRARIVPTGSAHETDPNVHIHTPTDAEIQQVRDALLRDPVNQFDPIVPGHPNDPTAAAEPPIDPDNN